MVRLEWWDGERMRSRKFVNSYNAEHWAECQRLYSYTISDCGKGLL